MEHFSLRWNNFHRNMSSGLRTLLLEDSLVDVTLAADGHFVQAHRLVLSVCSPYFKELFSVNPCNHPIVILKDVKHKQLTDLLSFIYQGEVSVHQEDLPEFLKTAELLQIRGLADQNFDKGNAPATTDKATTSEHSVPLIPADAVSFGRGIRDQTDRNAGTSNVGCPEDRCNERAPCEVAATTLPIVTANGQSSNATCLHSEELPTSVLLGIPIKQEPPDAIVDFTHNTDVLESEEIQGREAQVEHEDISSAQVVLERMNHEELRECDERVMTESATDEGGGNCSMEEDSGYVDVGGSDDTAVLRYDHIGRGSFQLLYNGFYFQVDRRRGPRVFWRCAQYRRGCRARCVTVGGAYMRDTQPLHNHAPPTSTHSSPSSHLPWRRRRAVSAAAGAAAAAAASAPP